MEMIDYKKVTTSLTQDLTKIEVFAKDLKMENTEKSLHELNERIKEDRFNVAVLGEYNRGKSTLINALLQNKILPSWYRPTTSCVNKVTYGIDPKALVQYYDGTTEEIGYVDLKEYGTQSGSKSDDVRQITLWYPTAYCINNVDIYDTPGLNDNPEMAEATLSVIANMDAAIFVMSTEANFSMSESEFISEKLLTSDVHRVIFVLNKIGNVIEDDQERLLKNTESRIQELVLPKAEKVLAERPEELENFKKMIQNIHVFGIDSLMALRARENFDPEMLKKSGFPEFEKAINDLLTRERGRTTLERETGMILKTARDMFEVIQTRVVPLTMDESDFAEKAKKAQDEINTIQKLTENEIIRLDVAKEEILNETKETWNGFMNSIKESINNTVEQLDISKSDLHGENRNTFVSQTVERIVPLMQQQFQVYSEQIQNYINEKIGQSCEGLNEFSEQVSQHMEEIGDQFNLTKTKIDIGSNVTDVLFNYMFFAGGIREGKKVAGIKGALVGGSVSALTTGGLAAGAGFALATAGVVVTAPVAIGVGLVASAIGLLAGRRVVHGVFWKEDAKELKKQIVDELYKKFNEIVKEYNISENLYIQIVESFEQIKKGVRDNTMSSLLDLQTVYSNMNKNYEDEKAKSEGLLNEYSEILESLSKIVDHANEIRNKYDIA